MTNRFELRARYIEGWYEMNGEKLLSSTTEDFVFDDPREPEPVGCDGLVDYMKRWDTRTRALGSTNEWKLENEVREDKGGIITDWEWWELVGTNICGMAFVKTRDSGVFVERITYFDRVVEQ